MVEFEVRLSSYGGELVYKTSGEKTTINSNEAKRSFERLRLDLPRHRNRLCLSLAAPAYLAKLDLSEHIIGDRATRALVEALLFGTVRCPEIWLY